VVAMNWKEIYMLDLAALQVRLLAHVGTDTWPPVHDAMAFAVERHAGQSRKGKAEPYAVHPLRTALILRELAEQKGAAMLCGALLHDLVEDTATTLDEIEDRFGPQVGDLVRALTYPPLKEGESKHALGGPRCADREERRSARQRADDGGRVHAGAGGRILARDHRRADPAHARVQHRALPRAQGRGRGAAAGARGVAPGVPRARAGILCGPPGIARP
jgi:hypothetical protein